MAKRSKAIPIIITILLLTAVFSIYVAITLGIVSLGQRGKKVTIIIPENVRALEVAYLLKKDNVVKNAPFFSYYLSYTGLAEKIKSGEYIFYQNMDTKSVATLLDEGPVIKARWITIPEGFTIDKIADRIDEKGKLLGKEFVESASTMANHDFGFLPKNESIDSLEGYLFPDTYRVWSNSSTADFVDMMLRQYGKVFAQLDWSIGKTKNLSNHQLLTIASLIERESKIPAERPIIASVIYNRLAKGMPLQIDATVQYALPRWKNRLFIRDLKVDSPYNTYKHKGLPPGPICSPGKASIEAALKPANTDFIYYVLVNDQGNHAFSNNYEDFLRNKRMRKSR